MSNLPVPKDSLLPLDPNAEEHFLEYLFSFTSPLEMGKALQAYGYTPSKELDILLSIILDPFNKPRTRMGAIKLLADMRNRTIEQSGALTKMKLIGRQGNITLEAVRTQRAVTSVQNAFIKEAANEQRAIPGDHQAPTGASSQGPIIDADHTPTIPAETGQLSSAAPGGQDPSPVVSGNDPGVGRSSGGDIDDGGIPPGSGPLDPKG